MDKFTEMGKDQLRAACKVAGISYSKLNNDGMREALRTAEGNTSEEGAQAQKQTPAADPAPVAPKQPSKPAPKQPEKAADRHTGTGLKIEKDREERNGVKRPSAGGKCREIWDYLDDVYQGDGTGTAGSEGVMPTAKMVREASAEMDWNPNNASIEFYQWRKFHGITGRQGAAPAKKVPAKKGK
jgi:hypothetical protein